jgi:signal transduction histidine kinase
MDGPPTVLIIDDEPGVRESLRAILAKECAVYTAASGEEALAVIESAPVDVITLDLKMPGLGGISVLERIRAHDQDIEALIITGYSSLDSAIEGIRLRVFDYVSKPFDVEHVRGLVRQAVARHRAVRRLRNARQELFAKLNDAFRTPLDVILRQNEILREGAIDRLTDEQQQALDRICSNSTALVNYLEGIFYLSDLESGELTFVPQRVRMADVFTQVCRDFQPAAAAKGLTVASSGPPELVVETDRHALVKLLGVLVDNAIKFTKHGEVTISACAEGPAGPVAIAVRDTGIGAQLEHIQEVLAEPRVRGRRSRRRQSGIGLGLHIARAIARHLGAALDVTSEPERGTVFRLTLPACRQMPGHASAATGMRASP